MLLPSCFHIYVYPPESFHAWILHLLYSPSLHHFFFFIFPCPLSVSLARDNEEGKATVVLFVGRFCWQTSLISHPLYIPTPIFSPQLGFFTFFLLFFSLCRCPHLYNLTAIPNVFAELPWDLRVSELPRSIDFLS